MNTKQVLLGLTDVAALLLTALIVWLIWANTSIGRPITDQMGYVQVRHGVGHE